MSHTCLIATLIKIPSLGTKWLLFATNSCPSVDNGTIFMAGNCTPWPHRTTDPQLGTAKTINHMDTHTIAHGARAWIPTHNRTARLTSTTVQHTWRCVKGTKTARHDWSHDNMPHIPLTCLWCRLGSAPRQSATYASDAKLATLPTCLTQALRPVPHAAKQGLLTELKKFQADQARGVETYTTCKQYMARGGQFD